jgi:rSAM/selenodomain-associated transferase 2
MSGPKIDVVIPTLNAAPTLGAVLESLAEGRDAGLVGAVLVADGGSSDATTALAEGSGARLIDAPRGRGPQLAAGAVKAESPWLLFLHGDTRLAPGWPATVRAFVGGAGNEDSAAVFRLAFDEDTPPARRVARLANWRARRLGLPYGDQGLLIASSFYRRLGGFRPLPLMEDVDLVRRIGRRRLVHLEVTAITSAARYRQGGWWRRPARNLMVLALYLLGVPPGALKRLYG